MISFPDRGTVRFAFIHIIMICYVFARNNQQLDLHDQVQK